MFNLFSEQKETLMEIRDATANRTGTQSTALFMGSAQQFIT